MGHDIREIEHELNVILQHLGLFIIQQSYGGGKLIARVGVGLLYQALNPLMATLIPQSNGPSYTNTTIGIGLHWPLMGGLLHLVRRGGD